MDTFDLKWPQTDATFYTDGWRCRIVWREKRGGMGGTIDNNDQCKKRVASSLLTAPYLLNALRARGHGLLAEEIEGIAGDQLPPAAAPTEKAALPPKAAAPVARPSFDSQLKTWLQQLDGSVDWESVAARRAKVWQPCFELADETLLLKAPAPKGKQEWALKLVFSDSKRKAQYVAAAELKGICCYLHERGLFTDAAAVENWLTQVQQLDHEAVSQAVAGWRKESATAVH